MQPIPVIALTGYLGAGKTTLLNHVLRSPDARIGVVINDFGELNVDAGLVTGQVDEPASIAGGCICCLPDDGGLDVALARLADPKLRLDAIIVEASGLADPLAIARMLRFSGVDGVRPGGVVDVDQVQPAFRGCRNELPSSHLLTTRNPAGSVDSGQAKYTFLERRSIRQKDSFLLKQVLGIETCQTTFPYRLAG